MRKLIIASLMLLGFAVSAAGQYRIVKLNSSQVQGQEPKADSILVAWDDGEGRHRWSSISIKGPLKFVTHDTPFPSHESWDRYLDGQYLETLSRPAVYYFAFSDEHGDTILAHQTILIQTGQTAIHYSREVGTDLKVVISKDDAVEISEAVSIDQQADFDPRTVDLSGIEEAAPKAEAAGQKSYARQIWRLVRRWQRAAANWP